MRNERFQPRDGFTLLEILVVIAIMTVIAGLLVAAAIGARRKADSDAAQAGVTYIAAQIQAYFDKRGQLPPDTDLDLFLEMLYAPLFQRWLHRSGPLTETYADALVEATLRAFGGR